MPKPEVRRFTAAELVQYDGQDGREAYIAYKGFVFNVTASPLWRKGKHVNEHYAGHDLTSEMSQAPHADDVMARFPIVGVLMAEEDAHLRPLNMVEAPPALAALLRYHPHPVSVHFPIALGLVAALLTLPELALHGSPLGQTLQAVAWWMVLVSALFTLPAALTGLWSWVYNYASVMSPVYRWKLGLTIALCLLAAVTVTLHWLEGAQIAAGGPAYWLYSLLVLLHGPVVLGLGWFGGRITFPDP